MKNLQFARIQLSKKIIEINLELQKELIRIMNMDFIKDKEKKPSNLQKKMEKVDALLLALGKKPLYEPALKDSPLWQ